MERFGTELKLGTKYFSPYAYYSLGKGVAYTTGGGGVKCCKLSGWIQFLPYLIVECGLRFWTNDRL